MANIWNRNWYFLLSFSFLCSFDSSTKISIVKLIWLTKSFRNFTYSSWSDKTIRNWKCQSIGRKLELKWTIDLHQQGNLSTLLFLFKINGLGVFMVSNHNCDETKKLFLRCWLKGEIIWIYLKCCFPHFLIFISVWFLRIVWKKSKWVCLLVEPFSWNAQCKYDWVNLWTIWA